MQVGVNFHVGQLADYFGSGKMLVDKLPPPLRPLARAWAYEVVWSTKERRAAVFAAMGGQALSRAVQAVEAAAAEISELIPRQPGTSLRLPRLYLILARRRGNGTSLENIERLRDEAPASMRHKLALLPAGIPAQRLELSRLQAVREIAMRVLSDHWGLHIVLTSDPKAVGLVQVPGISRIPGRDEFKDRQNYSQEHIITVPRQWRRQVLKQGLAIVNGAMTLDATALAPASSGIELFAACWIVQSPDRVAYSKHGYIARCGSVAAHGSTALEALEAVTAEPQRDEYLAQPRCGGGKSCQPGYPSV